MLTRSMLKTLWPRCQPAKIDAIAAAAPALLRKYGLTSELRVAHLMAQISHECTAGTIVRESMTYTHFDVLKRTFGQGHHTAALTDAEVRALLGHPQELAERVYGLGNPKKAKELGNTQPGDGYRFRGNGMLQLTGRGSHTRIGALIGFDLAGKPEMLESPAVSFECAMAEFVALKCLPAADADDVRTVTRRVNGGLNGLAERTVWLRKWKAALRGSATDDAPEAIEAEIEASVPPPAEPRAGESDQVAPMTQSTIGNGALVTGGGGILIMLKGWFDAIKDVPEGILNTLIAALQSPYVLGAAAVLGGGAYVYFRRMKMKQTTGV